MSQFPTRPYKKKKFKNPLVKKNRITEMQIKSKRRPLQLNSGLNIVTGSDGLPREIWFHHLRIALHCASSTQGIFLMIVIFSKLFIIKKPNFTSQTSKFRKLIRIWFYRNRKKTSISFSKIYLTHFKYKVSQIILGVCVFFHNSPLIQMITNAYNIMIKAGKSLRKFTKVNISSQYWPFCMYKKCRGFLATRFLCQKMLFFSTTEHRVYY